MSKDMIVNERTKSLIKKFEGRRLTAYRCSAGVLTIGYGHTSMAGAPQVTPGMKITAKQADEIFDRDIERFAAKIEDLIKVDLGENQFGACVSLAFNIGVGGFAKSSVLRFINKRQFNDAADAFMLWNKVKKNGKLVVEPGLTKRRAEEAALFREDEVAGDREADSLARIPDAPKGKPMDKSTTNIATTVTAAAGVTAAAKEVVSNTHSIFSSTNMVMLGLIAIIVVGAAWVYRERWLKARDWAV